MRKWKRRKGKGYKTSVALLVDAEFVLSGKGIRANRPRQHGQIERVAKVGQVPQGTGSRGALNDVASRRAESKKKKCDNVDWPILGVGRYDVHRGTWLSSRRRRLVWAILTGD